MTTPAAMTVVGFDVSLASTGWAALEYETGALTDCGLITTRQRERNVDNLTERLCEIHNAAKDVLADFDRADIAIEDGITYQGGTTTRRLAMAWAAVAIAAHQSCGIEPAVINVSTVKQTASGDIKGWPSKLEMVELAVDRWGDRCNQSDLADAAWTAEACRRQLLKEFGELPAPTLFDDKDTP